VMHSRCGLKEGIDYAANSPSGSPRSSPFRPVLPPSHRSSSRPLHRQPIPTGWPLTARAQKLLRVSNRTRLRTAFGEEVKSAEKGLY
jgi:hypothetical protein